VDSWLPGKFAARLQAAALNPSKIWLKVDKDSGHGSASIDDLRETFVDEMAFVHANA
jgi:protease II